ncbi:glycosyltransferase family 2 protein [Cyclobacterium jeungdonense]|uniref:Glycosyltransferase family 2 protein n=1 Tax=Cyclobacterium jeungdonense TaxID=708087 RepID=A0ABT8C7Q0_9BACT|nr:glycosyltransferase family 2 protein [Cyclobacterium jeungdonense]MDN3688810.1 glycosyltransferase family 2 protein [Cyclobacterium jeungdonense]
MVGQAALLILFLVMLQYLILWFRITRNFKAYRNYPAFLPAISVLLPCRNEAKNLPACLRSLEQLRYPDHKIRFLLADDHSEDETGGILAAWASLKNNRQLISLDKRPGDGENGKALALAAMATRVPEGELMVLTDADCEVPAGWAENMAKAYRDTYGAVTGITTISGKGIFARMQALDWWLTLGKVKVVSDWGCTLTAMGNNMCVGKQAYEEVGGFYEVRKEVTEDLALARALFRDGKRPIHLVDKEVLVKTLPEPSFSRLMKQRKRWMRGAFLLPWYWQLLLGLQVGFYLALVPALYHFPLLGAMAWTGKILAQSLFIGTFAAKTETKIKPEELIGFEIYNWMVSWSTVLYYFWPGAIQWKKRRYP